MSYRTDQWFRFRGGTNLTGENFTSSPKKNGSGYAVPGSDNQDFIYPARTVRGVDGRGNPTSTSLKRGYIRSLLTGDGLPITKCQFQFNPSAINQSVTQNTSILNFLQIDPAQYSQPLPGNVTFQFELFFDRSMEVNNGSSNPISVTDDPWANLGPEQVGVLHDLSSMYSIIGVGISDYMANRAEQSSKDYIDTAINTLIDKKTTEITAEDAAGRSAADERAEYKESASTFLNLNRGNTAFLLPLPVRVVFSSLYIVEGLVQDFNVLFTKFNTNMVPMQCSVTVTFEAKYIGFAKKDTFFTDVLAIAKETSGQGEYGQISDAFASRLDAIQADLGVVRMFVTSGDGDDESEGLDGDYATSIKMERFISQDVGAGGDRNANNLDKFVKILFTRDAGRLYNLMSQGVSVSIEVSGSVDAWRFTGEFREANPYLFTSISQQASSLNSGSTSPLAVSAGNSVVSALNTWIARSASEASGDTDSVYTTIQPAQGTTGDRLYLTALKLWSVNIGTNNISDRSVVSASTVDEWARMRDWACYSNKQTGGTDRDQNLAGIGGDPGQRSMEYDNADVYFAVKFDLQITVEVNGDRASKRSVGYIIRNENDDNFDVAIDLPFDWQSLRTDNLNLSNLRSQLDELDLPGAP